MSFKSLPDLTPYPELKLLTPVFSRELSKILQHLTADAFKKIPLDVVKSPALHRLSLMLR